MIFLSPKIINNFNRLVDWQMCSENWAYAVHNKFSTPYEVLSINKGGDRIDPRLLHFPSNPFVEITIENLEFSAKPFRITGQAFAWTMHFEGHAEIRDGSVYIVGKYTSPHRFKGLISCWNCFVISIALMALIFAIPISAFFIWEENNTLYGLLLSPAIALASVFGCTIMLSSVKILGIQVSLWNHWAGRTLQKFLDETTI